MSNLTTRKIDISLDLATRLMHPRPTVLITCINPRNNKPNIVTLAWTTPLSHDPPLVGISVTPKNFSHDLISASREFVVNIPTVKHVSETYFAGFESGRNVDKFAETGLTQAPAKKVKAPIIKECVAHLECRLVDKIKTGDHVFFIGEVLACYTDRGVFNQVIDTMKVRTIQHLGSRTYVITTSTSQCL